MKATERSLELLLNAYAYILITMPLKERYSINGQYMLSCMRSELAECYGLDPLKIEEMANSIEFEF